MGLVSYKGKWGRPEDISRADARRPGLARGLIQEYLDRRVPRPPARPTPSSSWRPGAIKTGSRTRRWRITPKWSGSTRRARLRGGTWATRNKEASGSSPRSRRRQAGVRAAETRRQDWKPKLEKLRDGLTSKDPARRTKAEQDDRRSDRPPRRADDLGGLPAGQRASCRSRRCRCWLRSTDPAASNALAALAVFNPRPRCAGAGDRDPDPPRPPRRRRPVDRPDPQAIQVSMQRHPRARAPPASCSSKESGSTSTGSTTKLRSIRL